MKLVLTKKEIDGYKKEYGVSEREVKRMVKEYSDSIEYVAYDRLDDIMKEYAYKKGYIDNNLNLIK